MVILESAPASTHELTKQLEAHRKLVETKEKLKDRAEDRFTAAELGEVVDGIVHIIKRRVTSADERAAIGRDIETLLTRFSQS